MNEISEEFPQVHRPKNETHFVTTSLLFVEGRLGGDPCLCGRLTNPERSRGVAEGKTHNALLIARKLSARLLPPWNPVRVCVQVLLLAAQLSEELQTVQKPLTYKTPPHPPKKLREQPTQLSTLKCNAVMPILSCHTVKDPQGRLNLFCFWRECHAPAQGGSY